MRLIVAFLLLQLVCANYLRTRVVDDFYSPVIGVLAQPVNTTHDYIASSYIKWLEAGGARTIVIPYDDVDTDRLLSNELYSQIDGIFLPGGGALMPKIVVNLLDRVTDSSSGDVIPVWGTCLGFEFLIQYFGGSDDALQTGFDAHNESWPLILSPSVEYDNLESNVPKSELYHDMAIRNIVTEQNVTLNNHHDGIEPDFFDTIPGLANNFVVTSTNYDAQARPFVSTIEPLDPIHLPVYGVQYHPEKNAFEYGTFEQFPGVPYEHINHSPSAISFALYQAQFFVNLVKRFRNSNKHGYTMPSRHPYVYTYPIKNGVKFEQIYLIPKAEHWTKFS